MPWVTFIRDFDWRVPKAKSKTTIAYKAGMKALVKQACADEAQAAGALGEGYRQPEASAVSIKSDKQIETSSISNEPSSR
jgi:hypothetical protein